MLTVVDEIEPVLAFDVVADKADFGAVISTEVGVSKIFGHVAFLGNILLIVGANQVGEKIDADEIASEPSQVEMSTSIISSSSSVAVKRNSSVANILSRQN